MFVVDPTRPASAEFVFQRFGFANPSEWRLRRLLD